MESREFQRNQLQFSYFSPNYLKFEEDFMNILPWIHR